MTKTSLHMIVTILCCQSINLPYVLAVPCEKFETACIGKWKPKEGDNESEAICKFLLKNQQMKKRPDMLKECEQFAREALAPPTKTTTVACEVLVRELRDLVKYKYHGEYCIGG